VPVTEAEADDPEALGRFIERFAAILEEGGVPPMAARAFAALLGTHSGSLTAAELGGLLRASPAAISGAVRYLAQVNLVVKERVPGSRRARYRLEEDVWYRAFVEREQLLARWEVVLDDGARLLGESTPAGQRARESQQFMAFLRRELPALMDRWQEIQAGTRPRPPAP
jgi:DNA-binding transcriptional regulator GbsR (MarR family)